jgi:hypothetical protein
VSIVSELKPDAKHTWQLPLVQGQLFGVDFVGLSQVVGCGVGGHGQPSVVAVMEKQALAASTP